MAGYGTMRYLIKQKLLNIPQQEHLPYELGEILPPSSRKTLGSMAVWGIRRHLIKERKLPNRLSKK